MFIEQFPKGVKESKDDLDLVIEAVMWYRALYYEAAYLVATGQRTVSEEEEKNIVIKDLKLDSLNQKLQLFKKEATEKISEDKNGA